VQEEEENLIENDINSFSLEGMELEVDIEKMFPTIDQTGNISNKIHHYRSLRMRHSVKKSHSLSKKLSLTRNLRN
jgi:hypothetical protein